MLQMNETIRVRRHALGMTQQELAGHLGVSAAAVSKWELGASYPDVTLLPALARLLKVDLNTLMGFAQAPDEKEIHQMLKSISELAKAQGIGTGVAKAEEILREYPSCGALLFGLAATLEGCMMSGSGREDRETHAPLLEQWYLRAVQSDDVQAKEAAAHMLAAKYMNRGEVERAQEMMNRLPKEPDMARWPLEVSLMLARGENEQAKRLLENTLFRRAGDVQQILVRLVQAQLDEGNIDQAQKLADVTRDFVSLLHMHPYTGHMAQLLPALKRRDATQSLKCIRAMLDALQTQWTPCEGLLYAHSGVKKSEHANMLGGIIREMQESEEYAFLRENEEFNQLLEDHTQV